VKTERAGADLTLRAVAAYGLPGAPRLPGEPLADDTFAGLLLSSERHRLLGLMGAAARCGDLRLQDGQRNQLEELLQSWLANALRVEALLLGAIEVLDAAGIEHRVLKGVALAHTVYPDPSWRVFADVDVLLPSGAFTWAVETLGRELGTRRDAPELRPGFETRFGKEALLRTADGLELDLHRTFVEGALGLTVHLPDLFASGQTFDLGGRPLTTLPPPQQLLHAAYAAVLGDWPPRRSAQRDVAQIVLAFDPPPAEVLELAGRWRARAVLARALTGTWEALTPGPPPRLVEWARSYRLGPLERLLLASHVGPARAYTRHAAALLVVPGLSGRLTYLRAIAWPQRSYLEARGFTRAGFSSRALRRRRSWRQRG
jgi:Uncharacterised nucleotidyltransferase